MKLTKKSAIQFADGKYETTFTLTRQESIFTLTRQKSISKSDTRYILNAITSSGFDLTMRSYGMLKHCFDANKRLKTQKSILAEMTSILDDVIEYASTNLKREIIKTLMVKTILDNSEYQWFKGLSIPFPTCSIKSIESGNPISWYYHDVFNTETPIEITFSRKDCGQMTAHASELKLYDLNKIQKLTKEPRFKEQGYAFFFYNEVKRLLGQPFEGSNEQMSGLFQRGAK